MSELEAELDAIMIKGCKVDACLDLFIARVLSFVSEQKDTPLAPQLSPYRFTNDLDNVPEEKLKDMEKELRENLNRLIPEYVSDNTEDVLKRAKRRLDRRVLGLEIEQMRSHKSPRSGRDAKIEKDLVEGTEPAEYASSDAYVKISIVNL
jgi:hypothetical protein